MIGPPAGVKVLVATKPVDAPLVAWMGWRGWSKRR